MTQAEYTALCAVISPTRPLGPDHGSDCTLLYGCDDDHVHHLYQWQEKLHLLVTRRDQTNVVSHQVQRTFPVLDLIAYKHFLPQYCDAQFCARIAAGGLRLPFADYEPPTHTGLFAGPIHTDFSPSIAA